ncbi:hypothetical protein DITRI_Ditri19aG0056900 [Diplodiscus trichospermus]
MFTYVGLLEFFYSEAPKGLKTVSTCFLWSSMAIGYYLSSILVKMVNSGTKDVTNSGGWLAGNNNIKRNHLNLLFPLLSLMSLANFIVYLFVAKRYKYRSESPVVSSVGDNAGAERRKQASVSCEEQPTDMNRRSFSSIICFLLLSFELYLFCSLTKYAIF